MSSSNTCDGCSEEGSTSNNYEEGESIQVHEMHDENDREHEEGEINEQGEEDGKFQETSKYENEIDGKFVEVNSDEDIEWNG